MAYLSKEKAATIKAALKEAAPKGWKLSIRADSTSITLSVMQAPIDLMAKLNNPQNYGSYAQLNTSYIDRVFNDAQVTEVFEKFNTIMNTGNYNNSDIQSDYFDIGHFVWMNIGRWDKEFQVKA